MFGLSLFGYEAIAERADAGDLDFDHVAGFDIRRRAVGAHPDHVARPQREIFCELDDERHDSEDHVIGLEATRFLAVHLDDGFHPVEIGVSLDPGTHRLEGIGILGAPQPAIGLLPGALGDVVADRVAEYAGHRVRFAEVLHLLADDDDELAFIMDLLGRICGDHDIFVMCNQRILRALADLGPVGNVRHLAALVGGLLEMLEVVQADAIKGARDDRELDFDVVERMRLRGPLPPSERIAADGHDSVAFYKTPGGPSRSGEFQPTHVLPPVTLPPHAASFSRLRASGARAPD